MAHLFYVKKVDVVDGVEVVEFMTVADACDDFVQQMMLKAKHEFLNVSGIVTLDLNAAIVDLTHIKANGDITSIDFDLVPNNSTIVLMLEQDVVGGHAFTLPEFENMNTQPTVSTTANKSDIITIMKSDTRFYLLTYIRASDTF